MVDRSFLESLRRPTPEDPLRLLVSACLAGLQCGTDGSSYGEYPSVLKLLDYRNVRSYRFCPEDFAFGTPREVCDIHGGTGDDVLDGKARVLTQTGIDWTEGMIKAAERMLLVARQNDIELAVLMDISAACGSQVIYDGSRFAEGKRYQIGSGVCAALLRRNGFKVISQRDYASLEILYSKLDTNHKRNEVAIDHHETAWYQEYFSQ